MRTRFLALASLLIGTLLGMPAPLLAENTGHEAEKHAGEIQDSNASAILDYRIVERQGKVIKIEIEYYFNGEGGPPWLSLSAEDQESEYSSQAISTMPILLETGHGKVTFTLKRHHGDSAETTRLKVKMWRTMLDVLAERTFESHLTWRLDGENEIKALRVVEVSDSYLELEVDYFYNESATGTSQLQIHVDMEGERNQKAEQGLHPIEIKSGSNTAKAKLFRPFPRAEWSRTNTFSVKMVAADGSKLVDRDFAIQAIWDPVDYLLSDGNGKRADLDTLYKRAYHFIDLGGDVGLKNGKHILDQILLESPEFVPAYAELARYHMKSNWNRQGIAQAERLLLSALELEPDHANTLVLLGYVYTHQTRYKEAEDTLARAEKLGTDNLWLHANWGELRHKQGKLDAAIERYRRVLVPPRKFDSNDRPRLQAYTKLAELYIAKSDLQAADTILGEKANEFTEDACLYGKHAEFSLTRLGKADAAIEQGNLALTKGCRWPKPVRRTMGAAYLSKWSDALANGKDKPAPGVTALYNKGQILFNDVPALYFYLAKHDILARIIPKLTDKGLDIDTTDAYDMSALAFAIQAKETKAVERLLANGADANALIGEDQWSPLMLAIYIREKDAVNLLIKAGADIQAQSKSGLSALDLARELGYAEIVTLLSVSGA